MASGTTTPITLSDLPTPERAVDSHKGSFGRVLVVGGSVGMSGSICLSAIAALRGGAGLVTAAVPDSIQSIVASYEPSYMTVGLATGESGELQTPPIDLVRKLVEDKSAVAIGPGLGQSAAAENLLQTLLSEFAGPLVMDADALNIVAGTSLLERSQRSSPRIITPHPGEFSRLTGVNISEINDQRQRLAEEFARSHQLIVVLKGAGTVVTDGSRTFINSTGNPGMATGGTGDVLTGLMTALLGQATDFLSAAALAVHLHGLAGDIAAAENSQPGMIASDLPRCIGKAWLRFQHDRGGC